MSEEGEEIEYRRVTYVFRPGIRKLYGVEAGYCVMGIEQASAFAVMRARDEGRVHRMKTVEPFFSHVRRHEKPFEIRKDDRTPPFAVGDVLELVRFEPGAEASNG